MKARVKGGCGYRVRHEGVGLRKEMVRSIQDGGRWWGEESARRLGGEWVKW